MSDVKVFNEFSKSMSQLGYQVILTSLNKNWCCAKIPNEHAKVYFGYDVDRGNTLGSEDAKPAWFIRNIETNAIIKRYCLRDQAIHDLLKFEYACQDFYHLHNNKFSLFNYEIEVTDRFDVSLDGNWVASFARCDDCTAWIVQQEKTKFKLD